MLKIRNEQMEVFRQYCREQFEERMAAHLRELFPARTASLKDEALLADIRVGIQKAKCYGLDTEEQIRVYLELSSTYGPNFDHDPTIAWVGRILRNHRLTGDAKIQMLEDHDAFDREEPE